MIGNDLYELVMVNKTIQFKGRAIGSFLGSLSYTTNNNLFYYFPTLI